jgi:hypothetical protein
MTTPGWRPAPPRASTLQRPRLLVEREDRSDARSGHVSVGQFQPPGCTNHTSRESPVIAVVQRLWAANAGTAGRAGLDP